MNSVLTETDRILKTLEFNPHFQCEMDWAGPTGTCEEEAVKWLTYVNYENRVCRRLACGRCITKAIDQRRAVKVQPING